MSNAEFTFWVIVGLVGAVVFFVCACLVGMLAIRTLLDIRDEKRRPGFLPPANARPPRQDRW